MLQETFLSIVIANPKTFRGETCISYSIEKLKRPCILIYAEDIDLDIGLLGQARLPGKLGMTFKEVDQFIQG